MGTLFKISDREIVRIKGDRWKYTKCYRENYEYWEGDEDSIQDRIEEIKNEIENCKHEGELRNLQNELDDLECADLEDGIKIWSDSYGILGIYPLSELNDYCYIFLDYDIDSIIELEDGYYQINNEEILGKLNDNNELELFEDYKDIIKEIGKKKYFKYFDDKISTLLEYYDDNTIFPMLENENERYSNDIIEYLFDVDNTLTLEEYNKQAETNYTSIDDVCDDWYWTKDQILKLSSELYN